jgi:hypothetical protein
MYMEVHERIWDAHIHLFPERLFEAIWGWFEKVGWSIPHARQPIDFYLRFLQNMGVEKGFLLPYCHKPGMAMELNRWVHSVSRENPWLIPFAGIHPQDEDVVQTLSTCLGAWGFAGVKLQLAVIKYRADHPDLYPVYREIYERGKLLVIHAGTAPYAPGQEEFQALGLRRILPVLDAFPGLKVVIPHFGLYELDLAEEILDFSPSIYVDTSWALANPKVNHSDSRLARFMSRHRDRVLFGTDFPILEHSPLEMMEALQHLVPDPGARHRILWENAHKLWVSTR